MRALFALLVVLGILALRQARQDAYDKTILAKQAEIRQLELQIESARGQRTGRSGGQSDEPVQSESHGPRRISFIPGLNRYVEHDARVSAMQSIGGGGSGHAPKATPGGSTLHSDIRKEWGWEQRSNPLDQSAHR